LLHRDRTTPEGGRHRRALETVWVSIRVRSFRGVDDRPVTREHRLGKVPGASSIIKRRGERCKTRFLHGTIPLRTRKSQSCLQAEDGSSDNQWWKTLNASRSAKKNRTVSGNHPPGEGDCLRRWCLLRPGWLIRTDAMCVCQPNGSGSGAARATDGRLFHVVTSNVAGREH